MPEPKMCKECGVEPVAEGRRLFCSKRCYRRDNSRTTGRKRRERDRLERELTMGRFAATKAPSRPTDPSAAIQWLAERVGRLEFLVVAMEQLAKRAEENARLSKEFAAQFGAVVDELRVDLELLERMMS